MLLISVRTRYPLNALTRVRSSHPFLSFLPVLQPPCLRLFIAIPARVRIHLHSVVSSFALRFASVTSIFVLLIVTHTDNTIEASTLTIPSNSRPGLVFTRLSHPTTLDNTPFPIRSRTCAFPPSSSARTARLLFCLIDAPGFFPFRLRLFHSPIIYCWASHCIFFFFFFIFLYTRPGPLTCFVLFHLLFSTIFSLPHDPTWCGGLGWYGICARKTTTTYNPPL